MIASHSGRWAPTGDRDAPAPAAPAAPTATPGARLRALLAAPELCHLMGAYDALSARIAAAEGFPALWASGLCMSTALGVRDNDEACWSQLLAVVETMVDAVEVPVLVDGDTGHGNFNTARRFTRKVERMGAAGVSLEDKLFPKMNSFVGERHPLAPVGEFCGKIMACKEAQRDPGFVVVARVEALIAGRSLSEALDRAHAYCEAGGDAIFIHSRKPSIDEVAAFARAWGNGAPLIVSPTTYYRTPASQLARLGIGAVICANQSMRAAVAAMRDACRHILESGDAAALETRIASLDDVFALMGYDELAKDEERYSEAALLSSPSRARQPEEEEDSR
jgi:phosphoenolpyruvate phosphomutase